MNKTEPCPCLKPYYQYCCCYYYNYNYNIYYYYYNAAVTINTV